MPGRKHIFLKILDCLFEFFEVRAEFWFDVEPELWVLLIQKRDQVVGIQKLKPRIRHLIGDMRPSRIIDLATDAQNRLRRELPLFCWR